MRVKLTPEEISSKYEADLQAGRLLWEKRRKNYVFKLARAYFGKIKRNAVQKALKRTMRIPGVTRSFRMKQAYTRLWTGFDMLEDFPVFAEINHIDELYPYFEEHADRATLDKIIADAESHISMPKIFDKPIPEELLPTESDLKASQENLSRLRNPRPRSSPKFKLKC